MHASVTYIYMFACNCAFFLEVLGTLVCQTSGQLSASIGCRHGTVRLVNGDTTNGLTKGRVEVCVNNIWGTITFDSTFQSEEAMVICQQLGFVLPEGTCT